MKKVLFLMCAVAVVLPTRLLAQTVVPDEYFTPYKQTSLRLPAVPLITNDPYLSFWSPFDKLTDGTTRHWSNIEKPMNGLLRVDGTAYRFMGTAQGCLLTSIAPMAGEEAWEGRVTHDRQDGNAWAQATYDDSNWAVEQAAWGTRGEYPHVRNSWTDTNSDIYVRRTVTLTADDLQKEFPNKSPKEREFEACKKYGVVFIIGIGGKLGNGDIWDGRAPDYDDWITINEEGRRGLNGDLLVWNPVLGNALELSSMGIRVSPSTVVEQLEERGCMERKNLPFHKKLIAGELTQTLGGGIGQSRLCMYFLRKCHIGEVQVSIWPEDMVSKCRSSGVLLL